jgi:tryptophan-rich sensory protein
LNLLNNHRLVEILRLLASILVCQLTGFISSLFASPSIPTWYADLQKPSFAPPNWVFAPVWVSLYILVNSAIGPAGRLALKPAMPGLPIAAIHLMGVALYLVWRRAGEARVRPAVAAFIVQLALNALWSPAFFGLQSPLAGLIVIVPLWLAILATILAFLNVSKGAALLLVPYMLWVGFAVVLNFDFLVLNR